MPEIVEAAVVAKPAAEGEDDIKAFLVPASGASVDPVGVLEHCIARVPYFAVPRYLEIVEGLPKTLNGKVLKRELRALEGSDAEWDREAAGYTVTKISTSLVRKDGAAGRVRR